MYLYTHLHITIFMKQDGANLLIFPIFPIL
jgi:hypothetical protein